MTLATLERPAPAAASVVHLRTDTGIACGAVGGWSSGDPKEVTCPDCVAVSARRAARMPSRVQPNAADAYEALMTIWAEGVGSWDELADDASFAAFVVRNLGVRVTPEGWVLVADLDDDMLRQSVQYLAHETVANPDRPPTTARVEVVAQVWLRVDARAMGRIGESRELWELRRNLARVFGVPPLPVVPDLWIHYAPTGRTSCDLLLGVGDTTSDVGLITCPDCLAVRRRQRARRQMENVRVRALLELVEGVPL